MARLVRLLACLWSVDTTIAALRILELSLGLSYVFLKSKVCVKILLVFSNKMQLKLPKVLRRVRLSLTNWGQWS